EIVSCPTCGRCEIDVIELTKKVEKALQNIKDPITVAVMGCPVNGPGEAREADIGIACGKNLARLFKKGQVIDTVKAENILDSLVSEVKRMV
ncbi:MAG: flavodoxin-dependent (E)-4-hydroxy-3-methylbut-2-enyl-diphosphate synthase, partial [Bifidobacteriaceae bacterium]|nr:flavodoxin-dependent (E)-4-hydroxy-3-methylbut-2-enyl-diphosphate synthase [Bifidobacteriaceae bacterium]